MLAWNSLNPALWLAWFAFWGIAARSTRKNASAEPTSRRLLHLLPLGAGFGLLFGFGGGELPALSILNLQILPPVLGPAGTLLTALGLLFSIWARIHLGVYWSGKIALKQGHRLIRTGPYRLARHPIYAGFLCAFSGSALSQGRLSGCLGLLIVTAAYWRKIYREELALHGRFGKEYLEYSRKTGLLLPWP